MEILKGYERRIRSGEVTLGDLATSESDCSSARKKGDLYVFLSFFFPHSNNNKNIMVAIVVVRGFP